MSVAYDDVTRWIRAFADEIAQQRGYLTDLDSAIGDGDHGINMDRGMQAVIAKLDDVTGPDIGALLKTIGMTLVSTVGGASGPLYGTLFLRLGGSLGGKEAVAPDDWLAALTDAVDGVQARGKAEPGDKTMLDTLVPAREALEEALGAGASFPEALRRSADAGRAGMEATIPVIARKGRASYLGERSAGHQDPGATSSYLLLRTAADAWGSNGTG